MANLAIAVTGDAMPRMMDEENLGNVWICIASYWDSNKNCMYPYEELRKLSSRKLDEVDVCIKLQKIDATSDIPNFSRIWKERPRQEMELKEACDEAKTVKWLDGYNDIFFTTEVAKIARHTTAYKALDMARSFVESNIESNRTSMVHVKGITFQPNRIMADPEDQKLLNQGMTVYML